MPAFLLGKPKARELFLQYCRHDDPELLKDYYYQHDILKETAQLQIEEAYKDKTVDGCISTLKEAARTYSTAREEVI